MGCLARLRAFFTAPVVIFLMNILSYFTFLLLFAYVLMVDFQPTPSWREYLIYFWLFSLVCEETRQVWQAELSLGGQGSRHSRLGAPGRSHTARVPTLLLMSPLFPEVPAHGTTKSPISEARDSPWLHLAQPCMFAEENAVGLVGFSQEVSAVCFGNVSRWRELFLWVNSQQDFQVLLEI